MSGHRWASRTTALAAGLLGSAVVLVFTRRADDPAAFALALASLAGVGLLLIVGPRSRRVLGLVLVGLGGGLIVTGLSDSGPLAAIAGLFVGAAGVLTIIGGGDWPDRGRRYEARGTGEADAPADAWRALDAGVDPTLDDPA